MRLVRRGWAGRAGARAQSSQAGVQQYSGPSYQEVRNIRRGNLNPAMLTYYREPLLVH